MFFSTMFYPFAHWCYLGLHCAMCVWTCRWWWWWMRRALKRRSGLGSLQQILWQGRCEKHQFIKPCFFTSIIFFKGFHSLHDHLSKASLRKPSKRMWWTWTCKTWVRSPPLPWVWLGSIGPLCLQQCDSFDHFIFNNCHFDLAWALFNFGDTTWWFASRISISKTALTKVVGSGVNKAWKGVLNQFSAIAAVSRKF